MSGISGQALLQCRDLHIEVGGKILCRQLDLEIRAGQCWAVLGRNGAGKSTLLHTLAGLHTATAGNIRICGQPLSRLSRRDMARHCGLLLQSQEDPFPASVHETVLQGRHPYLRPWQWESEKDHEITRQALKAVGMQSFSQRNIQTLSGGERQRVAIAELICQQPSLLLLDEPSNHLDLHHRVRILDTLVDRCRDNRQGVCMVLHDVNLAARMADHCLLLADGGASITGTVADVLQTQRLEKLYGHPLEQLPTAAGPAWLPK